MKKFGVSFALSSILASFGVFALSPKEFGEKIPQYVAEIFKYVLIDFKVDPDNNTSIIFAKFILMLVLVSVLFTSAKKLPGLENRSLLAFVVALGISILGLQFVNEETIIGILLPTGALTVALSVLIPLSLGGLFISGFQNSIIRKSGWVLFGVAFLGLGVLRGDKLGPLLWIYIVAAALSLSLLKWDGTITRMKLKLKMDNYREGYTDKELDIKRAELARLITSLSTADKKDVSRIKSEITRVKKQIKEMIDLKGK